jgi:hypothetical protein
MDKPTDFVERFGNDFGAPGVDVANVPQNQDPKTLLFGAPTTEVEPQDDTFKWDGEKNVFYVDVENNGRIERFTGETRTEVTKKLIEGKKAANQALADQRQSNRPRQPDTKLPFDPIQRRQPRELTPQEVMALNDLPPDAAQAKVFEARTGYTMDEVARSVSLAEEMRLQVHAATVSGEFVSAHSQDFHPSQVNMSLIDSWLKDRKLPVTRNNLEIAFLELGDKLKPAPVPVQEFTPPPPPVSPPSRPAPGAVPAGGNGLSREQVATIQSGSLADARSVIQDAFRQGRGGR